MAVAARFLDELAANATVAPVTRLVDGWLAKTAPHLVFRRANAVLPPPGAGLDPASASGTLGELEAWYGSLGRRVIVQVSAADPDHLALDALLAGRGYGFEAPVDVLVGDLAVVADAGGRAAAGPAGSLTGRGGAAARFVVDEGIDPDWARRHGSAHGDDRLGRARTEAYGAMLAPLGPQGLGGVALVGSEVVGIGFAVLERGWAGVFGMGTAPSWRRLGVAGSLLGALAGEARRRGARGSYLQVEVDNEAAGRCYRGLGFERSHGYHYRVSSPPSLEQA